MRIRMGDVEDEIAAPKKSLAWVLGKRKFNIMKNCETKNHKKNTIRKAIMFPRGENLLFLFCCLILSSTQAFIRAFISIFFNLIAKKFFFMEMKCIYL